jgi:hypothetical protein
LSLCSLSRSHTLLLTLTRAAAPEIYHRPKLGRHLDLLRRFISAARPFLYGLSCGEQALPTSFYFTLNRSTSRRSPVLRRPPRHPWCPLRRPNHSLKPLARFASSSSSRRTYLHPKPCHGAPFRASPATPAVVCHPSPAERHRCCSRATVAIRSGINGPY